MNNVNTKKTTTTTTKTQTNKQTNRKFCLQFYIIYSEPKVGIYQISLLPSLIILRIVSRTFFPVRWFIVDVTLLSANQMPPFLSIWPLGLQCVIFETVFWGALVCTCMYSINRFTFFLCFSTLNYLLCRVWINKRYVYNCLQYSVLVLCIMKMSFLFPEVH